MVNLPAGIVIVICRGKQRNVEKSRPYIAALLVVIIWSGWITISRYGVQCSLTPADITLVRYLAAFLVVLPITLRYDWKKFKLYQYLVIGLGVGFPYTMTSFYGLKEINAAHAGVLVNGMLPVLGAVAAYLLFREKVSRLRLLAIVIVFAANIIMSGTDLMALNHLFGAALLFSAAIVYTAHLIGIRLFKMTWKDTLVVVPTVNCILFIPIWFFLPSELGHAPLSEIAVQAFYQGLVVNVFALSCVAYAIRSIGTLTVSLFMSFVPVTTAILAWLLLGEQLNSFEIAAIIGCTCGLILYSRG